MQSKRCVVCGSWYSAANQDHEDAGRRARERWRFKARQTCGAICQRAMRRQPAKTEASGRQQARRMLPPGPCEQCGETRRSQIHHKDGNARNNDLGNLARLCLWCNRKTMAGQRASAAAALGWATRRGPREIAPTVEPSSPADPFEFEEE